MQNSRFSMGLTSLGPGCTGHLMDWTQPVGLSTLHPLVSLHHCCPIGGGHSNWVWNDPFSPTKEVFAQSPLCSEKKHFVFTSGSFPFLWMSVPPNLWYVTSWYFSESPGTGSWPFAASASFVIKVTVGDGQRVVDREEVLCPWCLYDWILLAREGMSNSLSWVLQKYKVVFREWRGILFKRNLNSSSIHSFIQSTN